MSLENKLSKLNKSSWKQKAARIGASVLLPIVSFGSFFSSTNLNLYAQTQADKEDDIVCVFYYSWYRNPDISGQWKHWNESGKQPPKTWASYYVPNYPNSTFNPSIQLYDSTDSNVLRWQDEAMKRAGIDIAICSWWGGGYEDQAFAKAIGNCKSVQWCIYYEPEGYGDPSPETIYTQIKGVIDKYGPTNNYAKIDDKWLVFVYSAGVINLNLSERWNKAKNMLANDGYYVYLNGDLKYLPLPPEHPWDGAHDFTSFVRQSKTMFSDIDNSTGISPGFWKYNKEPLLERSLSKFTLAWKNTIMNKENYRFILTYWNEWHEGTQIEPGQEIVPDWANGFYPGGYNYDYDFIDVIAPAAKNELHWKSLDRKFPTAPTRLEAEAMIWGPAGVSIESDLERRIFENENRIGTFFEVSEPSNLIFNIRTKADVTGVGRFPEWPEMEIYLNDNLIAQQKVQSMAYQNYSFFTSVTEGMNKIELELLDPPGGKNCDLILDYVDVCMTRAEDLSKDCAVNFNDFALLSSAWLSKPEDSTWNPDYDISNPQDNTISMRDLETLAENWLLGPK